MDQNIVLFDITTKLESIVEILNTNIDVDKLLSLIGELKKSYSSFKESTNLGNDCRFPFNIPRNNNSYININITTLDLRGILLDHIKITCDFLKNWSSGHLQQTSNDVYRILYPIPNILICICVLLKFNKGFSASQIVW